MKLIVALLIMLSPVKVPAQWTWVTPVVNFQNPVEQQTPGGALADCDGGAPCVLNPTLAGDVHFWDADDQAQWLGNGVLAAGQSVQFTRYIYADWYGHLTGMYFHVNEAGISVRADIEMRQDGELFFSLSKTHLTTDPKGIQQKMCILGPDYDNDALNPLLLPVIGSGSNGPDGVAKVTAVTFRLTNLSNKTSRKTAAKAKIGGNFGHNHDEFCPSGFNVVVNGTQVGTFNPVLWYEK